MRCELQNSKSRCSTPKRVELRGGQPFSEPLEKLPLQTDVGQSDSALQAAGQDALFRTCGAGGMVASQSRQDAGTDRSRGTTIRARPLLEEEVAMNAQRSSDSVSASSWRSARLFVTDEFAAPPVICGSMIRLSGLWGISALLPARRRARRRSMSAQSWRQP